MTRSANPQTSHSDSPARSRQITARVDVLSLPVDVRGPEAGDLVVLLHGFPEDSTSYDSVRPLLHRAGLRTAAFDQRGYAPGAAPRHADQYTTASLVADVVAVLDALGEERVHLVGHDWGGAVAWSTALAHPERLASLTVLSTPHPAAFARALRSPEQIKKSWYMAAFQIPVLPERVLSRAMGRFYSATGLPTDRASHYVERFSTPASLRGPVNWYRAAKPWSRPTGVSDRRVQVPTTYVWGSRDVALGRGAAEATAEYIGADYRFVELDAGHWLPELESAAVADAIVDRVHRTGSSRP